MGNTKSFNRKLVILSILNLIFGLITYIFVNPEIIFFKLLNIDTVKIFHNWIFECYLADFFFGNFIFFFYNLLHSFGIDKKIIYFGFSMPIVFEITQAYLPSLGTFDIFDIILYIIQFFILHSLWAYKKIF